MESTDIKKKRGRKPKVQIIDPKDSLVKSEDDTGQCKEQPSEDFKKNKRGRKPKFIYSTQDSVVQNQVSLSDDENIIVKLNLNDDILQKNDDISCAIDDHPYAYNRDEYCNLSNFESIEKNQVETAITKQPHVEVSDIPTRKVISLLKDFEEKNKNHEWPTNTSINCYWCCHKFENAPFGIPVNFNKENFEVFGCFCSLECAAAFNFRMNDNIDEMWERYNLINLLYRRLHPDGKQVKAAPDRLALKMFGGYLEIDEFREFFKSNRLININFPPMTSLTQQIEEVNEHELNNDYKYIPIDVNRIDKYKEKLMFKRNKPLINTKNSLESTMNLKYN